MRKKITRILSALFLVAILLLTLDYFLSDEKIFINHPYNHTLTVSSHILHVDVATTPAAMAQGLSFRLNMLPDQGMLFNFGSGSSQTPEFWMKDMNFSLDFLWIKNNSIIAITPNVPPPPKNSSGIINDTNLPTYTSPSPVDEVLEVNSGWAAQHSVKVGSPAKLLN